MAKAAKKDRPSQKEKASSVTHFLIQFSSVRDYLARIGAEPRSIRSAIVKEHSGVYYKDRSIIRFSKQGEVTAEEKYAPTENERARISAELSGVVWPEPVPTKTIKNPHPHFAGTKDKDMFIFYDDEGFITMIQRRFEDEHGKGYASYTYWNTDQWLMIEPEENLPIWGTHLYKGQKVAFLHEGAKAARYVTDMIENGTIGEHPWGEDMLDAVHLGWVGGAMNPQRTNWKWLKDKGIKLVYIIADNDDNGRDALPSISKAINLPCVAVMFDERFPVSFDIADPFPKEFFGELDGIKFYNGPSMSAMSMPYTWLTDVWTANVNAGQRGRPAQGYRLREHAVNDIFYIEDIDRFMVRKKPDVQYTADHFNRAVKKVSDSWDTAKLVLQEDRKFAARITYDPGKPDLFIDESSECKVYNTYRPTHIKPLKGPVTIWKDFMRYLVPDEEEADQLMRWCATLIARPDLRMRYAVLLISEKTGVGKTTLINSILAPLVGKMNVSYPNERRIGSEFNDWVGAKRLAYIAEIYQGHDFKVTNALKDAISDDSVTINEKYKAPYNAPNWIHIIASSNSMRALKLDLEDRRWFIPTVTEQRWPDKRFIDLHKWLKGGGLKFIHQWAKDFEDESGLSYVGTEEHAPMTTRKREVIDEGKSEYMLLAEYVIEAIANSDKPLAITPADVYTSVTTTQNQRRFGRLFDSVRDVRKRMLEMGLVEVKIQGSEAQGRVRVRGKLTPILANYEGAKLLKEEPTREVFARIDAFGTDLYKEALAEDM